MKSILIANVIPQGGLGRAAVGVIAAAFAAVAFSACGGSTEGESAPAEPEPAVVEMLESPEAQPDPEAQPEDGGAESEGSVERPEPSAAADVAMDPVVVGATTSVLGDIARNSVCDGVTVETLMSPGQDPHAFELSARQAAFLRQADLVIANGLNLEEGITDVILDAQSSGTRVLFVADLVDPIPYRGPDLHGHGHEDEHDGHEDEHDGHEDEHAHEHGSLDPHVWMDPLRMAFAARLIAVELSAVVGSDQTMCAVEYAASLEALDAEVASLLAEVPVQSRKLVTNHDAFGYFAERYGFEVVGTIIPSGATLAEPSASDVAALVEAIEHEGVPAIFAETTHPADLAEVIASEIGAQIAVVTLYTGSLGERGSGAETYDGMIRTNAQRIVEALSG